jgi:hypothetical protein
MGPSETQLLHAIQLLAVLLEARLRAAVSGHLARPATSLGGIVLGEELGVGGPVLLDPLVPDLELAIAICAGGALGRGDHLAEQDGIRTSLLQASVCRRQLRLGAGGFSTCVGGVEDGADWEGLQLRVRLVHSLLLGGELHLFRGYEEELEGCFQEMGLLTVLAKPRHVGEAHLGSALRGLVELLPQDLGGTLRFRDVVALIVSKEVPALAQFEGVEGDVVATVAPGSHKLDAQTGSDSFVRDLVDCTAHADESLLQPRRKEAGVGGVFGDVEVELANNPDGMDVFGSTIRHLILP